jgi:hypothetical protein
VGFPVIREAPRIPASPHLASPILSFFVMHCAMTQGAHRLVPTRSLFYGLYVRKPCHDDLGYTTQSQGYHEAKPIPLGFVLDDNGVTPPRVTRSPTLVDK